MLPALTLAMALTSHAAFADDHKSTSESAKEMGDNMSDSAKKAGRKAKRSFKKGVNRTEEFFCAKGDAACAAEKAKHRVEETGDALKDGGKNVKDAVTE